jgi:hypothetical protein
VKSHIAGCKGMWTGDCACPQTEPRDGTFRIEQTHIGSDNWPMWALRSGELLVVVGKNDFHRLAKKGRIER